MQAPRLGSKSRLVKNSQRDSAQVLSPKSVRKLPKKAAKKSSRLSRMQTWYLLQQAWAAVQVQVLLP